MRTIQFLLLVGAGALFAASGVGAQRGAGSAPSGSAAESAPVSAAVRTVNSRLAGAWRLVSDEDRDARGQVVPGRAPQQAGYIAYDPAGYMAVATISSARKTISGRMPTPDEMRTLLETYRDYWGSFAVDEAAGVVRHQTFGSLNPAVTGSDQVRNFAIAGNLLTLRQPPAADGTQTVLRWERLPELPNLTPTHRKLIGFWKLIQHETRNPAGELVASNPGQTGFIVYTATGHVMVHMMQPYRRRTIAVQPTPEETTATYRSYNGYFGTYTVNEAEASVVHHLEAVHNPASGGTPTDFLRFFELSGKRLVLKLPVAGNGDGRTTRITWERLGD